VLLSRQGQPRRCFGCGIGAVGAVRTIDTACIGRRSGFRCRAGRGVRAGSDRLLDACNAAGQVGAHRAGAHLQRGAPDAVAVFVFAGVHLASHDHRRALTQRRAHTGDQTTPAIDGDEQRVAGLPAAVAVGRRELLATRNFNTTWSPTVRRIGSLTMFPTTVGLDESSSLALANVGFEGLRARHVTLRFPLPVFLDCALGVISDARGRDCIEKHTECQLGLLLLGIVVIGSSHQWSRTGPLGGLR
jgi:hypothetical protein